MSYSTSLNSQPSSGSIVEKKHRKAKEAKQERHGKRNGMRGEEEMEAEVEEAVAAVVLSRALD